MDTIAMMNFFFGVLSSEDKWILKVLQRMNPSGIGNKL